MRGMVWSSFSPTLLQSAGGAMTAHGEVLVVLVCLGGAVSSLMADINAAAGSGEFCGCSGGGCWNDGACMLEYARWS